MALAFGAVYLRDLRLALRRRVEALLPVVFFVVAVSLFPLGVGPEPQTLRQIAAGVVWVSALLASMLSVTSLYAGDHADGSLEQMMLSGHSGFEIAAAKAAAHWTITGAPRRSRTWACRRAL
jgi:heme exporter protein B